MICLMESKNPMVREIAIEDWGHPYFIFTDEYTDSPAEKIEDFAVFGVKEIEQTKSSTNSILVGEFNTFSELIDFILGSEKVSNIYKKPLLQQITKII